ncbi:glycosyltransferase family 2 protein [Paracoccus sp. Z330]|uniref:Glycosyltransferase family 2 protein n=1 Tax=Paracoccus onchidii TaxID=3017813 RepID=A0ABT4ZBZ7_9RHOB|nr:glycosyltransferase family 2 protein [Paracoccus onchidii]MDB6176890.1 glycosyltransferase family 2 protein [Paracoccus onchidii]
MNTNLHPASGKAVSGAIDAVAIGRNEGRRLTDCLASLQRAGIRRIVYVDSGSTDGSVLAAEAAGASVIRLDMTQPFTAARARNAGLEMLLSMDDPAEFVQMIDGDCELRSSWPSEGKAFLDRNREAVAVCGRRRERAASASVYNRLCDVEWDTPVGKALACGGDALFRLDALAKAGGYRADLIAGEEPELCVRLRAAGGQIWRLDAEMTLHDAAMTRFSQWWRRSRRAGYAFAEGAALHGAAPERHWVAQTRRAVLWGLALPAAIVILAGLFPSLSAMMALIYPAQILRLATRRGLSKRLSWEVAVFTVLGKFPEAMGVLSYWRNRIGGRAGRLIEYK